MLKRITSTVCQRYDSRISSHPITPSEVFFDRRKFLSAFGMGMLATPFAATAWASQARAQATLLVVPLNRPSVFPAHQNAAFDTPPAAIARQQLTPRDVAASHNNFYEFLSGRGGPVWQLCGDFEVQPWKLEITGECSNPMTLDLDDLFAFDHEDRVYHFRCVERWAMNVPWSGFPLSRLLQKVEPTSSARYVRFESAAESSQMPGLAASPWYSWPYSEGLRISRRPASLAGHADRLSHPAHRVWLRPTEPGLAPHRERNALRHQLAVLQRQARGRPRLRPGDRLFWAWLCGLWPGWRRALVIVKPDTVLRWHRRGFRLYWRWKSRSRGPGRPRLPPPARRSSAHPPDVPRQPDLGCPTHPRRVAEAWHPDR